MRSKTINLSESEIEILISSLLFSSSVNVIIKSETQDCIKYIELAENLKKYKNNLELKDIQFIKEEKYEDEWSSRLYSNFKDSMEVITFNDI
jgi:hypothetical protein